MKRWILPLVLVAVIAGVVIHHYTNYEGVTPLMKAAKFGNLSEVQRLIDGGAEVDAQSRYSWTALMFACWEGHEEVAVALLEAGADPNHRSIRVDSQFETVGGHPPSTPLHEAIRSKHLGIVRALIDAGAKFDRGSVALAGSLNDLEFLEYLQSKGADWNSPGDNAFNATALCSASSDGNLKVVKWLLENGANPNMQSNGQTALNEAVDSDEVEVVKYLLDHGADPNIVFGMPKFTALYHAAVKYTRDQDYEANLAIINLLLKNGADPTHRAFGGEHSMLEKKKIQRSNALKGMDKDWEFDETKDRIRASIAHDDEIIRLLEESEAAWQKANKEGEEAVEEPAGQGG